MQSYLIYQRPMDNELKDIINENRNRPLATAYYDTVTMLDEDGPEDTVRRALMYSLYQPTMFMQYSEGLLQSKPLLEYIFDEGNGQGSGIITTTHLMEHSSLSVGDIVVNLLDNNVFVCMPNSWHQMELASLELHVD